MKDQMTEKQKIVLKTLLAIVFVMAALQVLVAVVGSPGSVERVLRWIQLAALLGIAVFGVYLFVLEGISRMKRKRSQR